MSDQIGQFFDALSTDYTAVIERCFPRYREMLAALLDYLPPGQSPRSVLELGCGTGNLTVLVSGMYPDARLTIVDLSEESLGVCRDRLGENERLELRQADMRGLEFANQSFDLVVSSIAVHHLTAIEKQQAFANIQRWLTPDGWFCLADQFRGATQHIYERHIERWRELTLSAGSSEADWEMWMEHQRDHDHHDPLPDQIEWLRCAGFESVDCVWRYLLWGVVTARKPDGTFSHHPE